MKLHILFVALLLAVPVFGVVEIGEQAPNLCYKDINEQEFCLEDLKGTVAVLIYNAGWCPPCNSEMRELAPKSLQFADKPVTFVSLSGNGWDHGSQPSLQFLKEWKAKYNIPDKETDGVNFIVASAPKDFGKHFIAPPLYIPNVAILNAEGVLAAKEVDMSVSKIVSTAKKLMAEE